MLEITMIGIDLAERVFQLHAAIVVQHGKKCLM